VPGSKRDDMRAIEVFADVRCPFTHVGLRRLVDWRAGSGAEFVLRVRAWPLELVNAEPLASTLIAEEADELRRQVAPDLFTDLDDDRFPCSSIPAMSLAAAAYRRGADDGERASLALRDAMFEHGTDIADPAALERIAGELGVPRFLDHVPEVIDDWHEGRRRGVIGSPHFFVGDDDFFCPSLHIETVDGHVRIHPDPAGFDELIRQIAA
jgi:predicted DsbA family dithiol-disulfide isomerase